MNKLFILVLFALIATTLAININVQPASETNEKGILPLCMVCSYVVDRIDGYLQDHTNTTEIVSKIDHDCEKLSKWESQCENMVSYIPEIITLLEEKKSAEIICKLISFC